MSKTEPTRYIPSSERDWLKEDLETLPDADWIFYARAADKRIAELKDKLEAQNKWHSAREPNELPDDDRWVEMRYTKKSQYHYGNAQMRFKIRHTGSHTWIFSDGTRSHGVWPGAEWRELPKPPKGESTDE